MIFAVHIAYRTPWRLAAIALAALIFPACDRPTGRSGDTSAAATPSAASADAPNVLLITLDTTRPDHLGCYGYAAARTPALDSLAAGGVRFADALAPVPLTLPSHASLLTGVYPPTTGLRLNSAGVLRAGVPTLAEHFHARGYRTGAFVAAWVLNATFGLNRGFDTYNDQVNPAPETGERRFGRPERAERPGDAVCDAALAWLDQDPGRPFFAWVHFFDPHHPYEPPAGYQDLPDPYDGEIAFMDAQVLRLLDWLARRGQRARTLIIACGDHGEAFGEHGEFEHGLFVYDTTMKVPLLMAWPGKLPAGRTVAQTVRLIDIMPTVLELLGWEPAGPLDGESLRAAFAGDEFKSLPAYGESEYPWFAFGWAPLRAYWAESWKYIAAPRPELYDRAADPGELTNVLEREGQRAAALRADLAQLQAGMQLAEAAPVKLTDEDLRKLESLGYVGVGTPPQPAPDRALRDAKDVTDVARAFKDARQLAHERKYAEVVARVEPLVERSPESDEIFALLGEAYSALGRLPEAERAWRNSLRAVPTNPQRLCELGDVVARQARIADAVAVWQQALAAAPGFATAHNRIGMVHYQQRQWKLAAEHFRQAVVSRPDATALTNLASALAAQGEKDEPLKLLHQALAADPTHAPAHRALWQLLAGAGRHAEALTALRDAAAALPQDAMIKRALAGLLAARGHSQDALAVAEQACMLEPNNPESHDVLGIARAASGDFPGAIAAARQAMTLAQQQGRADLASQIAARIRAYEAGRVN